jgi:hypothetical protein
MKLAHCQFTAASGEVHILNLHEHRTLEDLPGKTEDQKNR